MATTELREDVSALATAVSSLETRATATESAIAAMQPRLATVETGLTTAFADISLMNDEIAALELDLEANRDEITQVTDDLQDRYDDAAAHVEELVAEVATLAAAVDAERLAVDGMRDALRAHEAETRLQTRALFDQIAALRAKLAASTETSLIDQTVVNAKIADLLGQIASLQAETAAARANLEDLEARFERHHHTFADTTEWTTRVITTYRQACFHTQIVVGTYTVWYEYVVSRDFFGRPIYATTSREEPIFASGPLVCELVPSGSVTVPVDVSDPDVTSGPAY